MFFVFGLSSLSSQSSKKKKTFKESWFWVWVAEVLLLVVGLAISCSSYELVVERTVKIVLLFSVDLCDDVVIADGVCSVFEIAVPISIFLLNEVFWYDWREEMDLCVNAEMISVLKKLDSDSIVIPVAWMLWFV